ncbi:NADH-quinone oxidoreductase subunit N [Sulfurimonas lithotrophica]|uniref:NADH-quinone oxidoreductase subunit N n=1 Tax=Sulfurimonas lithotrophica TaxID=2590022 RepID=A0A5P8P1G4_9BACT|nr:NADH-quinone oxidoreductase subunit N [Sulfurimonas lithotrophica]QFR49568.1 NADH-quinone oxidoreductase subunit N [Sulfurimonas lithotrophica]
MRDLLYASPMAVMIIGAFVLMIISRDNLSLNRYNIISVAFLSLSLILQIYTFDKGNSTYLFESAFGKTFIIDKFAKLFDLMFTIGSILTLLINTDYFKRQNYFNGEYFAIILFSVFGMMMLSHSNELVSSFIALEIATLSIYTLVGYHKFKKASSEAMMKYIILGSLAGALFMLGVALIYGAVGSTLFSDITIYIKNTNIDEMNLLLVGATLMMITIMFKIGAVPFNSWVIDVYQGAPSPITMFMASTFKISVFALALRLYLVSFSPINEFWIEILQAVTIATLIGGSLLAISQQRIKRMLAASSIVHTGYMLIALSSIGLGAQMAASSLMFYLIAYFISSVGAFGIISFLSSQEQFDLTYNDFKGFAERRPYMALLMSIFMLSLAGFPSTIGFLGKFNIFTSSIESGQIFITALGITTAFISVYYYFKLIAVMYFYSTDPRQNKLPIDVSTVLIFLMAGFVIWGGIGTNLILNIPGADSFINIAQDAISSLKNK